MKPIRHNPTHRTEPHLETLEPRRLMSGVADLVHTTATLSHARQLLAAATAGDLALFAGGDTAGFDTTDEVEAYDPLASRWFEVGPLSSPRDFSPSISVAGKALFAGTTSADGSTTVDVYDR